MPSHRCCTSTKSQSLRRLFFLAFLLENAMTTLFFSHHYQSDFLKYINWDMQKIWRGLPNFLSNFNVLVKLYSITLSRYSTLFEGGEMDNAHGKARLKQKVFTLLAGRVLDDDNQGDLENLQFQIDLHEDIFLPSFIENIPTIVRMMRSLKESGQSSEVAFEAISKTAIRLHYLWKLLGVLDSLSALIPSLYFGVLTGYLLKQRQLSTLIGFSVLGFICKIPCAWVYFKYRVPSNAEFIVWIHSFVTIGLPKSINRKGLWLLCLISLLTAIVDASTIFYPSQNALRYYFNVSMANIENPAPVSGNKASLVLVVSITTSMLYAITSFGNTFSSSLFLLFTSSHGKSQQYCQQPLSFFLGLASITFSQMIGVFSLLNLFQVLNFIDSNETFSWSESRITFSVVAFFLALLPTYKSYRYTLPKVLQGAKRLYANRCACQLSCQCVCGGSQIDDGPPDLKESNGINKLAYRRLTGGPN